MRRRVRRAVVHEDDLPRAVEPVEYGGELLDERGVRPGEASPHVWDSETDDSRIAIVKKSPGYSEEYWKTMSELGWLGLPFSEDDGGFGGDQIDTMVLMEQLSILFQ